MVKALKVNKFRVLRPVVECTLERPILGRLLFPFFVVGYCWVTKKYFIRKINLTISGKAVESFWVAIMPKFKVVDPK